MPVLYSACAGYRDDDDGALEPLEEAASAERLAELVRAWETDEALRRATDPEGVAAEERDLAGLSGVGEGTSGEGGLDNLVAHVKVPDQEAIKQAVLARRKEELLAKLLSSAEDGKALPQEAPRVEDLSALRRLPPSW